LVTSGPSLALDPAKLEAECARGMELQLLGQIDLAGQIYHAIFQSAPQHPAANYCFGMLQVQAQRPLEALPYLKTALLAQQHVPDYWLGYLEALLLAGRSDAARNILGLARQQGLAGAAVEAFAIRLEAVAPSNVQPSSGVVMAPPSAHSRPFIVLAPAFKTHSAGIRVMHTLCNELNESGHTAYLMFYRFRPDGAGIDTYIPDGDAEYCKLHTSIPRLPPCSDVGRFRDLIDAAYVIYPEVVSGNPLNAKSVVRYVLNSPAANGYPMREDKHDYIVAFSSLFWANPHFIATMVFEEPLFNDDNSRPAMERTMDCTYIGKGAQFGDCFRIQGSVLIERNWPADKQSLSIMLRNTRYFYTWDLNSQTNIDALLCGVIPVVVRWAPFTAAILETDFGPFPYAESALQSGVISVAHHDDAFEKKRRDFIDSYMTAARGRLRTLRTMAADIERHFSEASRHADVAAEDDGVPVPLREDGATDAPPAVAAQVRRQGRY